MIYKLSKGQKIDPCLRQSFSFLTILSTFVHSVKLTMVRLGSKDLFSVKIRLERGGAQKNNKEEPEMTTFRNL